MRRRDKKRLYRLLHHACNTSFSSYAKCVVVVRAKDFHDVKAMLDNNLLPEQVVCVEGWIGMPQDVNLYLMGLEDWHHNCARFAPCDNVRKYKEAWRKGYEPQ